VSTYLDDLLAGARRRVDEAARREPLEALRERVIDAPAPPSFHAALAAPGVQVIAEIKRASPSKGDLQPDLDARAQARAYVEGGAAAISVLTEPDRFKGDLRDLADVAALGVPALRKDFLVDPYQVWEARAAGASAVLLIVAALDEPTLAWLHDEALGAGLAALVEVHDTSEAAAARRIGATIVGVNARDLRTFELDRDGFARLRPELPDDALAVAESGIRDPDDVRKAADEGADAVLVGEALVRAEEPTATVAALVDAGRPADDVGPGPARVHGAGPDVHPPTRRP
jgi:indole-3-glycerol phosphate synthase